MTASERVRQKKLDAKCARILHEKRLARFRALSLTADVLSLAVPIGYMTVRFLAKGTQDEHVAECTWEAVAALLAILIVVKMGFRWSD